MTYVELSEDGGGSHKFYEVVVAGTQVTITYGRIGESGQTKVTSFPTEAKARAAAAKKVAEKSRKGYAPAVRGVRRRRAITRRTITSTRSTAQQAPVLWRFNSGASAFGIFVDGERCWVGNQRGDVYTVSHSGTVTGRFRLPDGVKCIVADDFWIYAGCDDGRVYDLSGKVPRSAYEIAADVDIYWLDIHDGVLGVSDRAGRVTAIDYEDEFQWARNSGGDSAWMVRCDAGRARRVLPRLRGDPAAPLTPRLAHLNAGAVPRRRVLAERVLQQRAGADQQQPATDRDPRRQPGEQPGDRHGGHQGRGGHRRQRQPRHHRAEPQVLLEPERGEGQAGERGRHDQTGPRRDPAERPLGEQPQVQHGVRATRLGHQEGEERRRGRRRALPAIRHIETAPIIRTVKRAGAVLPL
ncbi:WGR domain-containing protein [Nonomuraea sp. GTA35]|uniref:WGR domain-containing protein n=1 Tax=Nonomuraea sp. GTA35 TaxID=1676746 RepID=UPI0035C03F38